MAHEITELLAALELALPYVQRVAATVPFENARLGRKLQAEKDVRTIKAAIAQARTDLAA